ncbi:MAG: hypothetical protein ACI4UK_06095, partial [Floccifex sp.]
MEFLEKILNVINLLLGPCSFVITIISLLKIQSVENQLKAQKEKIVFNKKYKSFCKEIDNQIKIISSDSNNGIN